MKKRTGTINWIQYNAQGEPPVEEIGQLQCDCCVAKGRPGGVMFYPSDLPPELVFGPELIGQRVGYRHDCNRRWISPDTGESIVMASNIHTIDAAAPAACGG